MIGPATEVTWQSRRRVDLDAAGVRERLFLLHQRQSQHPELPVAPAHDERVHEGIAHFPEQER